MNIVYISCLSGNKAAGFTYSVPAQIESQSRIDNVFWYNLNSTYKRNDTKNIKYSNIKDFPSKKISELPTPYNSPDLVVFQGVYFIDYYRISKELVKHNIPYIIIPRGSLTRGAQKIKALKKKISNKLIFNKFIKNALAIQYLNRAEYRDSGDWWNENHLIVPNGTHIKTIKKTFRERSPLKGVFIGRLHVYHKGIDLLIEACAKLKSEIDGVIQIDMYGKDQNGSKHEITNLIVKHGLENIIKVKDGIYDSEKEAVLLDSDFFVLTSRFEGHPMGLIEAVSYGLPSLVTTGTNMAKEIESNNAGWIAETEIESIVTAIKRLIREKNNLEEKGNNAIKLSRNYDWGALAQQSHSSYNKLIN
ncbi:glycosyltransferase [Bacillus paranthracis]|uniref:Glycosyltransferase n=1 Tax=Bacillus paranthracis TaxID=2026186 RepID=A0AAJ1NC56_9BACI|nr:glycosyltransferase [Bacillus paranthracis]MDG0947442.1 glycosyltransferase [Bacillus paranthracis]MDG0952846.1 glycosyltransferase [Bacillus paranthracis]